MGKDRPALICTRYYPLFGMLMVIAVWALTLFTFSRIERIRYREFDRKVSLLRPGMAEEALVKIMGAPGAKRPMEATDAGPKVPSNLTGLVVYYYEIRPLPWSLLRIREILLDGKRSQVIFVRPRPLWEEYYPAQPLTSLLLFWLIMLTVALSTWLLIRWRCRRHIRSINEARSRSSENIT